MIYAPTDIERRLGQCEDKLRLLESSYELLSSSVTGLLSLRQPQIGYDEPLSKGCDYAKLISFTPKQHATMQLLALGKTNREIAETLRVAESTAKVHDKSIMKKTSTTDRREIVAKYRTILQNCSAEEYELYTTIPKDWAINPDSYPQHTTKLRESYHAKTGKEA